MIREVIIKMFARVLLPLVIAYEVCLYYSASTPFQIAEVLQLVKERTHFDFTLTLMLVRQQVDLESQACDVILDYLYDEHMSSSLEVVKGEAAYFDMATRKELGLNSISRYGDAFSGYLQDFNFTNVQVISNSERNNLAFTRYIVDNYPLVYRNYI